MKQCSRSHCEKEVFKGTNECVLHCKKSDYSTDFTNNGILKKFYDALIDYMAEYIVNYKFDRNDRLELINYDSVKAYFLGDLSSDEIVKYCEKKSIIFNDIYFPSRDSRDSYDYLQILIRIESAHFLRCSFSANELDISDVITFYERCEFFSKWSVTQSKLLENVNNVLYQDCIFRENVDISSYPNDEEDLFLDMPLFCDCSFEDYLYFYGCTIEKLIFKNIGNTSKINKLHIEKCKIESQILLNKVRINYLSVESSEFNANFELKNSVVAGFKLTNSKFSSHFDAYSTDFGEFHCFNCVFDDFVGFEKAKFGVKKSDNELNHISIFRYVTFLSFVNFRNTTFNSGLDLENANLKEAPNFLNIKLYSNSTNRETLRIIKDSFDKIGNYIEGNKFFALEMKKYKQELELSDKKYLQEEIIFFLNENISNFGQSYLKPIGWILFFAFIHYLLVIGYENNCLYKVIPAYNDEISLVSGFFNGIAENITLFKRFLREGMEFVSLVFHIIFGSLIWQTIVAVKRHTRRS